MKKQIARNLTLLALVVGLALAASVSANGQTKSHQVTADIPFDFIVADKTLPSGKYEVRRATNDGPALRIVSRDAKTSAIRLAMAVPEKSEQRNARLVFHRYGQTYFLAEVWSGADYGLQLMRCKTERNIRDEIASNVSKSDEAKQGYEVVEVLALLQ